MLTVFTLCALLVVAFSETLRAGGALLRERKEELKQAQALAHLGSYVLHVPYSKHDHWSDEAFRIVGLDPAAGTLSPEEYIRRVVHPADQAHVTEVVRQSVAHTQAFDFEYRVVRPDGSIRYVQSIGKTLTDGNGIVVNLVGTLQDITERKVTQKALEESEARLVLAQAAAEVGVWDWDIRTDTASWSEELYALFGLERRDFTPSFQNWLELIHPDDREPVRASLEQALNGNREIEVEYRIIRPDGQLRWLVGKGRTYEAEDGRPIRMIGIALDITERKNLQLALEDRDAKYRAIVEEQTELICRFRPDTVLTFVHGAYCWYFRTTPEEVLGRSALWIVPDGHRERLGLQLASPQGNPRIAGCEHEVVTPDAGQPAPRIGGRFCGEVEMYGKSGGSIDPDGLSQDQSKNNPRHETSLSCEDIERPDDAGIGEGKQRQHDIAGPGLDRTKQFAGRRFNPIMDDIHRLNVASDQTTAREASR